LTEGADKKTKDERQKKFEIRNKYLWN